MYVKCEKCGIESEAVDSFTKVVRGVFSPRKVFYCPTCSQGILSRRSLFFGLIFAAIASWFVLALSEHGSLGWILFNLVLINLLLIPMIFLHEAAHLATVQVLGLRPVSVSIGYGKPLINRKVKNVRFQLRSLPLGYGQTRFLLPPTSAPRLKLFLTVLSGLLVHVTAIAGIIVLLALGILHIDGFLHNAAPVTAFLFGNIGILLVNILPRRVMVRGTRVKNDGMQLLTSPLLDDSALAEQFAAYYVEDGMEKAEEGRYEAAIRSAQMAARLMPDEPETMADVAHVYSLSGQYEKARQLLQEVRQGNNLSPGEDFMLLNNIAWEDVMIGRPELLREADDYSLLAYANLPWEPAVAGTRGAVLVELGDIDTGAELLKDAFRLQHGYPRAQAAHACWLGIAASRKGDSAEARRYFQLAHELDSHSTMLHRLEDEAV